VINSFSGAHPFRPQCIITELEDADPDEFLPEFAAISPVDRAHAMTVGMDHGFCPRCLGPLPEEPIKPAGSRITSCRCVPVCGQCGEDEVLLAMGGTAPSITLWPVRRTLMLERLGVWRQAATAGVIAGGADGPVVIEETGVTKVKAGPPSGGWLEFGYDDQDDIEEMER
jgi:hypothetical protein